MTSTVVHFLLAVGAIAAVCYALTRVDTRRPHHRISPDRSGANGGDSGVYGGGDGWSLSYSFGGHHSSCDGSGQSTDGGGGESCGTDAGAGDGDGGDGGGGDGGGGGD